MPLINLLQITIYVTTILQVAYVLSPNLLSSSIHTHTKILCHLLGRYVVSCDNSFMASPQWTGGGVSDKPTIMPCNLGFYWFIEIVIIRWFAMIVNLYLIDSLYWSTLLWLCNLICCLISLWIKFPALDNSSERNLLFLQVYCVIKVTDKKEIGNNSIYTYKRSNSFIT